MMCQLRDNENEPQHDQNTMHVDSSSTSGFTSVMATDAAQVHAARKSEYILNINDQRLLRPKLRRENTRHTRHVYVVSRPPQIGAEVYSAIRLSRLGFDSITHVRTLLLFQHGIKDSLQEPVQRAPYELNLMLDFTRSDVTLHPP